MIKRRSLQKVSKKVARKVVHSKKVGHPKTSLAAFIAHKPHDLRGVSQMLIELSGMLKPAQTMEEARIAYNDHPVEKLLSEKRIPVLFGMGARSPHVPQFGCYPQCRILYSALKEIGFKPRMIRYFVDITGAGEHRPHTSVLFEYKGSTYLADPFFSRKGRPFLHKVSDELLAHYKELEKKNQFQEIEPGKVSFDRLSHERETGVLG